MAIKAFIGAKHLAEEGEGMGEQVERGIGSDERVEEESGLAIGEGEEDIGLVQLATRSIARYKLDSNEVMA
ncbi:hypothetical protein SESBI_39731 [Sesbania bispinosa]|nr:hypothetical protein SESBI_39731 [Sesbania bispinosa]